jgi:hypothetical protein
MEELDFIDFWFHSLVTVARDMFNRHGWSANANEKPGMECYCFAAFDVFCYMRSQNLKLLYTVHNLMATKNKAT